MKKNTNRIDYLTSLRNEEIEALSELDLARNTGDPIAQHKALQRLKRSMFDFFIDTYLQKESSSHGKFLYSIDYSYFSEWRKDQEMKSIHSEIEKEENREPIIFPGSLGGVF